MSIKQEADLIALFVKVLLSRELRTIYEKILNKSAIKMSSLTTPCRTDQTICIHTVCV